MDGIEITNEELKEMASVVHDEWLKRNSWVYDPNYGNPLLAVPFSELSKEEQDKDIAQLIPAIEKVKAYIAGQISVDDICNAYGLTEKKGLK